VGLYVEGMLFMGVSLLSGKCQKEKRAKIMKEWKKSLRTTYCYQGEQRRQHGDGYEGTTWTSREEGEGEKGGKGDIGENPYKRKGSSIFLCTKVMYK